MNKEFKIGQRVWSKEYKEFAVIFDDSYIETSRIRFNDGEQHSVFNIDLHQTADDMFEELGYDDCEKQDNNMIYKSKRFTISFGLENKEYWHDNDTSITVEEHHAIHQKMIELGWIE